MKCVAIPRIPFHNSTIPHTGFWEYSRIPIPDFQIYGFLKYLRTSKPGFHELEF